jgi:hypothetical protein
MLLSPNSAPDSFAPSHCKTPDFEVVAGLDAVLDDDLETAALEEVPILLADVVIGTLVEIVRMELEEVAKCSMIKEEVARVDDVTAGTEVVDIKTLELKSMMLECLASGRLLCGSNIL